MNAEQDEQEVVEAPKVPLTPRALRAARDLGLKPEHVLAFRETKKGVHFVTHGGAKLTWPNDGERPDAGTPSKASTLRPEEKDGVSRNQAERI